MLSDPLKARGDHGTMKASAALGKLARNAPVLFIYGDHCVVRATVICHLMGPSLSYG